MRRASLLAGAAALVFASASSTAAAEDADPWLGRDKALHFSVAGALAASGYVVGGAVFDARGHALLTGGALAAAAGIAKETLDLAGYGDPSWKDLAWDGIGGVCGLAVAWSVDLLVRGVSARHPLLVVPYASSRDAGFRVQLVF
ncbi:MAG: putative lipoprotein [Labilithrix sp.]|nr:putative lipoprotein [Labilithrix sp.]